MTAIRSEDVIQSVADALQYISYYHPPDYIANLARLRARRVARQRGRFGSRLSEKSGIRSRDE